MIDPIGIKPANVGERRLTQSDAVAAVSAVSPSRPTQPAVVAETGATQIARDMAASPPVDYERVEMIKAAIADGSFPIVPAKIADRLIAAQLRWLAK